MSESVLVGLLPLMPAADLVPLRVPFLPFVATTPALLAVPVDRPAPAFPAPVLTVAAVRGIVSAVTRFAPGNHYGTFSPFQPSRWYCCATMNTVPVAQ